MPSWHQQKALNEGRAVLYHQTLWTVVETSNVMDGLALFDSESKAKAHMDKRTKLGKTGYILKPRKL